MRQISKGPHGDQRAPDWYNAAMIARHPKSVRRRMMTMLYEHYCTDPLHTLASEDMLAEGPFEKADLWNAFYLHDRGLIELMIGYNPPFFTGARITADGIDLCENRFEFNLRFPAMPGETEEIHAEVPVLMERLVEEADLCALDGEARRSLLRDVQYLRDELARPADRWRREVIEALLAWMEGYFDGPHELPSLDGIKQTLGNLGGRGRHL